MQPNDMQADDALVVVDVQKDFCPGGKLAIENGDEVVGVLNRWLVTAVEAGAAIVVSRDWHPPGHISFEEQGGTWPSHCVRHTEGAELHEELDLPDTVLLVSKGRWADSDQYSALDGTGLTGQLRRRGVKRLIIGGLAKDVCVRQTVLDACEAAFEVHLLLDATRPVDADAGRQAVEEMRSAGAIIEEVA